MKKILLGLLCLACTGTAWGQATPTSLPAPQPTAVVLAVHAGSAPSYAHIQQVSGGRLFAPSACATACGATKCCAEACCAPKCCETALKTICVPEPAVLVIKKITYSSTCEKICFPNCSALFGGGKTGCNTACDQGNCDSQVYQKKYLIKKICITECPTTRCVPVTVPACEAGRGGHHGRAAAAPAVVETIPAQPLKR